MLKRCYFAISFLKKYGTSIITLAMDKLEVVIHFTWISQFPLDRNHFSVTTELLISAPYLWFRKVI